MREILFRGQTRKYGEKVRMGDGQKLPGHWVYGGVLQGAGSHSIIYGGENVNDPGENFDKWCVHTDTLGQFTGLTDKNGKKIFEGDAVTFETTAYSFKPCVVAWSFTKMRFIVRGREANYPMDIDFKYEIIGNIHDNPELLENP